VIPSDPRKGREMWPFTRDKLVVPAPGECLPGRSEGMPVPERHYVSGRPLAGSYPEGMDQAVFGLGCFWGAERVFWQAPGVWVTAVGYAGGTTPNPTYEEVCSGRTGHTEAVLVVYHPRTTSYEALLKLFWESHDPTQGMRQGNDIGTQYRSAIYTFSPRQAALAEESKTAYQRQLAPAVSGEESLRILRPRRHRGQLSAARKSGCRLILLLRVNQRRRCGGRHD